MLRTWDIHEGDLVPAAGNLLAQRILWNNPDVRLKVQPLVLGTRWVEVGRVVRK